MEVIDLRLGEKKNEYPAYGLTTAPIYLQTVTGNLYESDQYKAVLKNNELIAITSKRYTLFPNEEALRLGEEVANELGFKKLSEQYSRGGNIMFAHFISDKLSREVKEGDVVYLGYTVRNSIDGSTGLGFDLFTYRLRCENGAVLKNREGVSLTRKHIGDIKSFVQSTKDMVALRLIPKLEELISLYKNWAKISLNLQIAKSIAERIPAKHLPDYINVERKTHKVSLSAAPSVWQTFNDITEAIWHGVSEAQSKAIYTDTLHRVLIAKVV